MTHAGVLKVAIEALDASLCFLRIIRCAAIETEEMTDNLAPGDPVPDHEVVETLNMQLEQVLSISGARYDTDAAIGIALVPNYGPIRVEKCTFL